jgi:hypothetical protein
MSLSSRLLRVGLILVCIIALITGVTFWSWRFTTDRLEAARSIGIFSSPAEGMLTLIQSGWSGIQEVQIFDVQEKALGGGPHVWFVSACIWADSRADGSAVGSATHDYDSPGSYFVNTPEGWVLMPETSLPLFVGFWMKIFGLAGSDIVKPVHDPSREIQHHCVREFD